MLRRSIRLVILATPAFAATLALAQPPVVRTADPIARGMKLSDFPRTVKVSDNVYTYEDFHAGPEKFTTTNMFVVTRDDVLITDGQSSPAETKCPEFSSTNRATIGDRWANSKSLSTVSPD